MPGDHELELSELLEEVRLIAVQARRLVTEVKAGGYESQSSKAVNINGPAFVRLVLENYYQERITLSDVSSYLNVRVKHLPRIEQAVLAT